MTLDIKTITRGDDGGTVVTLYTGYNDVRGDRAETGDVLRIDSSTLKRGLNRTRGTFDNAAQIALTRDRAVAIRDALDRWLEEDYDRPDADHNIAAALVPGTVVQIADVPMWDRETTLVQRDDQVGGHRDGAAADFAGRLGIVVHQVAARTYGVGAGRVVVRVGLDDWDGISIKEGGRDIHVSSLTVVEPPGFHDPAPVYTPHREYRVGDTVIVSDPAYVTKEGDHEGWVYPAFFGKAGTVTSLETSYGGESVEVRVGGRYSTQSIDVAHLRNISAEFRTADKAAGGVL